MTPGVAVLPMYDWPEVAPATDRLWAVLRDALAAEGIAAPQALDRRTAPEAAWRHPRLVLGQTCGLPFVRTLAEKLTLLGAPDYGVPGAPPGHYRSAVVVRRADPRQRLEEFRGARLALNGRDSQSGYAAILHHAAPLARAGRFFAAPLLCGSHAASAQAVADGGADLASLDYVSWRLFRRHRPAARRLRLLMLTDTTPGLPYVAARGVLPGPHRRAVGAALQALDPGARRALGIRGFQPFDRPAYQVIASRLAAAEARLTL